MTYAKQQHGWSPPVDASLLCCAGDTCRETGIGCSISKKNVALPYAGVSTAILLAASNTNTNDRSSLRVCPQAMTISPLYRCQKSAFVQVLKPYLCRRQILQPSYVG